jgi:hypothetical protein
MLNQNSIQAPRLYYKDGHLYAIHTSEILNKFDCFIDGFVYLFGIYFAFDLKYPECFKQLLGLFHEFLFLEFPNVEVSRNIGFMNTSSCINKNI